MSKLDGIAVPAIMAVILLAGTVFAVLMVDSTPETAKQDINFSGVLNRQGNLRLNTDRGRVSDDGGRRGFKRAPAGE